jgi:hypothetical protein
MITYACIYSFMSRSKTLGNVTLLRMSSLSLTQNRCVRRDCVNFVCLLVYSRTSNFSVIWRQSPLPVTGLQILVYARRSGPLSREGSVTCHPYCDTRPRFLRSHPKDLHLHPTVGFEPPTQGSSDHCARRSNHCATQALDCVNYLTIIIVG